MQPVVPFVNIWNSFVVSRDHLLPRQHIERSHILRPSTLPSSFPPPLLLFPPHIPKRLLSYPVPGEAVVRNGIGASKRQYGVLDPLHAVEIEASSTGLVDRVNRDFAQDLIDAAERDEDLLNGDASEETGLEGDVGDVGGLIQPGLRDDVVGLLQLVVDVELEGGGGIGWFRSNEESVVISVWMLGTGVEGKV